jgi:hypothetical protein
MIKTRIDRYAMATIFKVKLLLKFKQMTLSLRLKKKSRKV